MINLWSLSAPNHKPVVTNNSYNDLRNLFLSSNRSVLVGFPQRMDYQTGLPGTGPGVPRTQGPTKPERLVKVTSISCWKVRELSQKYCREDFSPSRCFNLISVQALTTISHIFEGLNVPQKISSDFSSELLDERRKVFKNPKQVQLPEMSF